MVLTKPVTVEALEQYDGHERYELIRGELVPMSPGSPPHGRLVGRLTAYLDNFVDDNELGAVYSADTGVVLERDPDTVLGPDIQVVRGASGSLASDSTGFSRIIPDLAIEAMSPSDSWSKVREKVAIYLAAGVPHAWIVHPRDRSVTWITSGGDETVLTEADVLDGGELLSGFCLPLEELFR